MLTHYLAFFGCWILGIVILFLMLKNSNHSLKPGDILFTLILSVALSVVFSFAAEKANLFHWTTCIAFAFLGGFVTYKFLDKQYQPKKLYSFNPLIAIPLLNIFHSGGAWILPFLPLIGAIICFVKGYKASKSGSWVGGGDGKPLQDGGGNVSFTSTWGFKWGVGLVVAAIAIFVWIASDYKGV